MSKPLIVLVALLGLGLAGVPVASAQEWQVRPVLQAEAYTVAELEQLVAPIALYPDVLLSTVLIAATYPLEIVQAARWSRDHPGLRGEAAVAAVTDRDWDPAVKALVAFPEVLDQLDTALDWTQALGDAFLFQESDVMDAVQELRLRAADTGHLRSDEHVRVVHTERTVIVEPVRERVVYVPWVDTRVVYGPWWHPYHPPVRWAAPVHYRPGRTGLYWSSGFAVSSGLFFTQVAWPQRHVLVVQVPVYVYPSHRRPRPAHYVPGQRWRHAPRHRRGVAYAHPQVQQRYAASPRVRASTRSTARSPDTRLRATPPASMRVPPAERQSTAPRVSARPRSAGAPARLDAATTGRGDAGSSPRRERSSTAPVARLAAPPGRGQATTARTTTQPPPSTPQGRVPVENRPTSQARSRSSAAPGSPPASSLRAAPRQTAPRQSIPRQSVPRQSVPREPASRGTTQRLAAPARDVASARGRGTERGRGDGRRGID